MIDSDHSFSCILVVGARQGHAEMFGSWPPATQHIFHECVGAVDLHAKSLQGQNCLDGYRGVTSWEPTPCIHHSSMMFSCANNDSTLSLGGISQSAAAIASSNWKLCLVEAPASAS